MSNYICGYLVFVSDGNEMHTERDRNDELK